jgi:peptide-methionine (S)-S-oxide reductase
MKLNGFTSISLLVATATASAAASGAEPMRVVPAYAAAASGSASSTTAVLAGGCFWGVQGVFQHVKGVAQAVSGYAGGSKASAIYEVVGSGLTGHAEAVKVSFDPRQISYARLLQIYFSVAHDPTELNRQGPDSGTQYRSTIFPQDEDQARVAKAYIEQLNQSKAFRARLATTVEPGRSFFPAEAYHQDFLARHPDHGYIVVNDLPKVDALKRLFPDLYRTDPVLVSASAR